MAARGARGRAWLAARARSRSSPSRPAATAIQDRPLAEIGGKALWTKELDLALLDGRDRLLGPFDEGRRERPARPRSRIAAMLPRADVRDRLIGAAIARRLAARARGSAPARRAARRRCSPLRPDLRIVPIRGNVETRLRQARGGRGRRDPARRRRARPARARRGRQPRSRSTSCCRRPAQGAIGIECRADDARDRRACSRAIDHRRHQRRGRRPSAPSRGAGRDLPFAGRRAGAGRRRRRSTCAARLFSEDGADMSRDARALRGRRPRRARRARAGDAGARAAVDPALVRGRMKPLLDPAPRARQRRDRGARARRWGSTPLRCPLVRGRAGRLDRARPGGVRRPAADQRQRGAPRRRGAWPACATRRVSRSARRPPRRRARPGFDVVRDRRAAASTALLDALPARQRLLHLAGADHRRAGTAPRRSIPIAVYRAAPLDRRELPAGELVALVHIAARRRAASPSSPRDRVAHRRSPRSARPRRRRAATAGQRSRPPTARRRGAAGPCRAAVPRLTR